MRSIPPTAVHRKNAGRRGMTGTASSRGTWTIRSGRWASGSYAHRSRAPRRTRSASGPSARSGASVWTGRSRCPKRISARSCASGLLPTTVGVRTADWVPVYPALPQDLHAPRRLKLDVDGRRVRSCERHPCWADCTTSTPSRRRRRSRMESGPLNRMTEDAEVLKSSVASAGRDFCGAQAGP